MNCRERNTLPVCTQCGTMFVYSPFSICLSGFVVILLAEEISTHSIVTCFDFKSNWRFPSDVTINISHCAPDRRIHVTRAEYIRPNKRGDSCRNSVHCCNFEYEGACFVPMNETELEHTERLCNGKPWCDLTLEGPTLDGACSIEGCNSLGSDFSRDWCWARSVRIEFSCDDVTTQDALWGFSSTPTEDHIISNTRNKLTPGKMYKIVRKVSCQVKISVTHY